jgi:hypothetical protein
MQLSREGRWEQAEVSEARVREAEDRRRRDQPRCEHEQHIGMFALDDHMATIATVTLGLPDRIAW